MVTREGGDRASVRGFDANPTPVKEVLLIFHALSRVRDYFLVESKPFRAHFSDFSAPLLQRNDKLLYIFFVFKLLKPPLNLVVDLLPSRVGFLDLRTDICAGFFERIFFTG